MANRSKTITGRIFNLSQRIKTNSNTNALSATPGGFPWQSHLPRSACRSGMIDGLSPGCITPDDVCCLSSGKQENILVIIYLASCCCFPVVLLSALVFLFSVLLILLTRFVEGDTYIELSRD